MWTKPDPYFDGTVTSLPITGWDITDNHIICGTDGVNAVEYTIGGSTKILNIPGVSSEDPAYAWAINDNGDATVFGGYEEVGDVGVSDFVYVGGACTPMTYYDADWEGDDPGIELYFGVNEGTRLNALDQMTGACLEFDSDDNLLSCHAAVLTSSDYSICLTPIYQAACAYSANDIGQVVGMGGTLAEAGDDPYSSGFYRAWVYDPGTDAVTDIGNLGSGYTSVYTINNRGVVYGYSWDAHDNTHVFLYQAGPGVKPADRRMYEADARIALPPALNNFVPGTNEMYASRNSGRFVLVGNSDSYLFTLSGIDLASPWSRSGPNWNRWAELYNEGVPFAVVRCRGNKGPDSLENGYYPGAFALLSNAWANHIPVGGYCWINFGNTTQGRKTGEAQMKEAIDAARTMKADLSFMAIDVEDAGTFTEAEQEANLSKIKSAIQYAKSPGVNITPIIYTSYDGWGRIVGRLADQDLEIGLTPLWDARYDGLGSLRYDWKNGKQVGFVGLSDPNGRNAVGPWVYRSGKQFYAGVPVNNVYLGESPLVYNETTIMRVDDDTFDMSLFTKLPSGEGHAPEPLLFDHWIQAMG